MDVTTSEDYHDHMDVGIRELKARLSEYVERAAGGEVIRVTDRGTPRAVLMALPTQDNVTRGLEEGWVVRSVERAPGLVEPVRPVGGPSTADALDEDRG